MQLFPDVPPPIDFLGFVEEVKVAAWAVHVYPIRAARILVTADIHVAHARDTIVIEALQHLRSVQTHEHIVVPCILVGMQEDCRVGKAVVVVDEVREVNLEHLLAEVGRKGHNKGVGIPWLHAPCSLGFYSRHQGCQLRR